MDIRPLSSDYAVSPQIDPADAAAIRDAGYATVICNRPDREITPDIQADAMRDAIEAAGLRFVLNPVIGGALTQENVDLQAQAMAESNGPTLAYCASGNRSSIVWLLSQAASTPVDDLLAATRRAGYDHEGLRPQLSALAGKRA
jgi:uncharacterized protein (TIGR01244 family)